MHRSSKGTARDSWDSYRHHANGTVGTAHFDLISAHEHIEPYFYHPTYEYSYGDNKSTQLNTFSFNNFFFFISVNYYTPRTYSYVSITALLIYHYTRSDIIHCCGTWL